MLKKIYFGSNEYTHLFISLIVFLSSILLFVEQPIENIPTYIFMTQNNVSSNGVGTFALVVSIVNLFDVFYKKSYILISIGLECLLAIYPLFLFLSVCNSPTISLGAPFYGMTGLLAINNIIRRYP